MPFIKKDAPAELIETIHQIETRADSCYAQLKILRLQANVTVWALLVGAIDLIEREIATRGDNTFNLDAALLNISRFVPVAMKWAFDYGKPTSKLATRHWTPNLASEVNQALFTAHLYTTYLFCLPMWHKHRYAAESVSPALVRFTALGGDRNRQVSAYQKGFRPTGGNYKAQRAKKPDQTPRMQELFQQVFQTCHKKGPQGSNTRILGIYGKNYFQNMRLE